MEFQITAATLNGAMNGLKAVISVVAAAVPHAAPAVPAASAVQLALSTTLQGIQTAKLRAASQMTKKAFRDPKNRRLGLKVRKMNPTLAKYTIGYGAVEEEDPIAVSMAIACGIDEEVLKNPGTNVAKVKAYLEAKFPDDGSVKGHWEEDSWQENLPDPAVTMIALAKLYGAVNEHYKMIAKVPPNDLAGLVAVVQKKIDPKETRPEMWQERCELLKQVDQAFVRAGKTAAKQAEASDIASVFAEFADAAADLALEALLQVKTLEAEAANAGPARAAAGCTYWSEESVLCREPESKNHHSGTETQSRKINTRRPNDRLFGAAPSCRPPGRPNGPPEDRLRPASTTCLRCSKESRGLTAFAGMTEAPATFRYRTQTCSRATTSRIAVTTPTITVASA